jgi:hypothetical protein
MPCSGDERQHKGGGDQDPFPTKIHNVTATQWFSQNFLAQWCIDGLRPCAK